MTVRVTVVVVNDTRNDVAGALRVIADELSEECWDHLERSGDGLYEKIDVDENYPDEAKPVPAKKGAK